MRKGTQRRERALITDYEHTCAIGNAATKGMPRHTEIRAQDSTGHKRSTSSLDSTRIPDSSFAPGKLRALEALSAPEKAHHISGVLGDVDVGDLALAEELVLEQRLRVEGVDDL